MANAVYPLYKQALLAGTSGYDLDNDTSTDGPYVELVDTGTYSYNAAHDFRDDLSGVVGTAQRITSPTVTTGTFDGNNVTFTAVSGNTVEALVYYRNNSGATSTKPLFLYYDQSGGGLPVTPNGGDITVTFNASGIFTISDANAKENITPIYDLGPCCVYSYNYRGDSVQQIGFIAQEIEQIVPDAVREFDNIKRVDYAAAITGLDRMLA